MLDLGTYETTIDLLQKHRDLLLICIVVDVKLDGRWRSVEDIRSQAGELLSDAQSIKLSTLLMFLSIHDPSLILFWFFVGYMFCSNSSEPTTAGWTKEFCWSYCYLVGRHTIRTKLLGYTGAANVNRRVHEIFQCQTDPIFHWAQSTTDATENILLRWWELHLFDDLPVQFGDIATCPIYANFFSDKGIFSKLNNVLLSGYDPSAEPMRIAVEHTEEDVLCNNTDDSAINIVIKQVTQNRKKKQSIVMRLENLVCNIETCLRNFEKDLTAHEKVF